MVTLPSIADTYRCQMFWRHSNGQSAANVMHFHKAGSSAALLAAALDANVTANMWANVSGSASVAELHVTPLDGISATYVLAVSGAKWTGAGGVGDEVPQAAAVVSLRTTQRGQRHRGRLYLPFQNEANIANGSLVGSLATFQTAWNSFQTAMTGAGFILCIASYGHSEYVKNHQVVTRTWAAFTTDVNAIILEQTLGTQRRRQSRLR